MQKMHTKKPDPTDVYNCARQYSTERY